ncbi:hypothetical protein CF15_02675 [Pyrodictium occultum]|uniref:Uncharacterized protein n=1 Tax=Pyrodictium occultum TaxID=2309 RepID=A0A0V8RUV3_PYROC|nr:hypothetical protein [Pyrodictium occultum]KSW11738.1 hypothetical protein CF15_02675 [Pyrodictium occultum]
MRSSPGSGSCRVRVLYRDEASPGSLLRAGMVAAAALLLSGGIRRWVCVEAVVWLEAGEWRPVTVRIDGSRVRWLRADEPTLLGVLSSALERGSWPGIEANPGDVLEEAGGCVEAWEVLEEGLCSSCILARGRAGFKPWWLLAAAMVAYDERCLGGCGRGEEGAGRGLGAG